MPKFNSKEFNPQAFGAYVKTVKNAKKNELAKSKAIGSDANARASLSSQTGSIYTKVPYFGRISGKTSQNNDGNTDIKATGVSTFSQGFVVASRMDSWTERSFSKNITAGVDFLKSSVAPQIAEYKMEVRQDILLAILEGIFSMNTTGSDIPKKAAKEFMEKHIYDISNEVGEENAGLVRATTLNTAIQRACGDNKGIFSLILCHSTVSTNLENMKLLKFLTYTDADGIERELTLGQWNGRLVLVDDSMPTEEVAGRYTKVTGRTEGALKVVGSGAIEGQINLADVKPVVKGYTPKENDYVAYIDGGTVYTSYVLGNGAIVLDDIGDANPYEMSRDPAKNGGQDTLYVRDRYICGAEGISYNRPKDGMVSVSNEDLADGTNWNIICNDEEAIDLKTIPILKIVSRG